MQTQENDNKQSRNSKNQQHKNRTQRRSLIGFGPTRKSLSKESKAVQPNQISTLNRLKNIKFGKALAGSKVSKQSHLPNAQYSDIKLQNSNASSKSSRENSNKSSTNAKDAKTKSQLKLEPERLQIKIKPHYSPLKIQQADQFSFSAVKEKQVPYSGKKPKHYNIITAKSKGRIEDNLSFDQFESSIPSPNFVADKNKGVQRQFERQKKQITFDQKVQNPANNPQKGQYLEIEGQQDVFNIKSLNMFSHNYSANAFRANHQIKVQQKTAQIIIKQEKLYNSQQQALIDRKVNLPRHYDSLLSKFGLKNFSILNQKLQKMSKKQ